MRPWFHNSQLRGQIKTSHPAHSNRINSFYEADDTFLIKIITFYLKAFPVTVFTRTELIKVLPRHTVLACTGTKCVFTTSHCLFLNVYRLLFHPLRALISRRRLPCLFSSCIIHNNIAFILSFQFCDLNIDNLI